MKNTDIKNLSDADLNEKLAHLKKDYTDLKITHAVSALENPMQIQSLRRTIARIATELTNRALQNS
jgi:large subunit ribosomal protein L29